MSIKSKAQRLWFLAGVAATILVLTLPACATRTTKAGKLEGQIKQNQAQVDAAHAANTDNAAAATKIAGQLLADDPTPTQYSESARLAVNYVELNLGQPTAKTWLEWEPVRLSLYAAAEAKADEYKAKLDTAQKTINVQVEGLAKSQTKIAELDNQNKDLTDKLIQAQKDKIAEQQKKIEEEKAKAKRDDLLRKGLLAAGTLLLVAGVVIGYLKKDITVIKWFGGGAGLAFIAAWLFGQWWFPWFMAGVLILGVFLLVRKAGLAGDLVGGIEDVRTGIKNAIKNSKMAHPEYVRALNDIKAASDSSLKEWVTEADGTAAHVDAIRREKGLL